MTNVIRVLYSKSIANKAIYKHFAFRTDMADVEYKLQEVANIAFDAVTDRKFEF